MKSQTGWVYKYRNMSIVQIRVEYSGWCFYTIAYDMKNK